ncbi:hypothetical protein [Streptomyces sp. NBC_00557]|uniref:hypothetical protein n=1 Tax=Streptomyces sp. NBC_00557 TaxID=2975776 RepID=UPI002E7FF3FF|nr:hypothetical protein [Streptomyces sp. NBC_00557]WUC39621.1 hypothetical protein OG956_38330 [Streptomyces sp. NBC_00557]
MTVQYTTAGWARALTHALHQAAGDASLQDRARRLLATGQASPLNVNQGFATTKFPLPGGRVARPRLLVTPLTAGDWDRMETAICARPDAAALAGTAAISDQLTDPAHTAGIPIVPSAQDISHTCTCTPDAARAACPHSVAVGILLTERVRTAPAPLFTLRGRAHHHLKKRLRANSPAPQPADPPVPTADPTTTPLSPRPRFRHKPPERAGRSRTRSRLDLTQALPVLHAPLPEPPEPLPGTQALRALAANAARAGTCLDGQQPAAGPTAGGDIARFLSLVHGAAFRQAAMDHLGLDIVGMGHLQLAHTHGGPAGAAVYLEAFSVDHDTHAHAQASIQPLRPAPTATILCEDNRLTDEAAGIQLRYGPDGRWCPYRAPYGIWQPVPGPSPDPAQAYRAARRSNQRAS